MKIKPGALCEIVQSGTGWDGRFCVAEKYLGDTPRPPERYGPHFLQFVGEYVPQAWDGSASWMEFGAVITARCLKPITDPDADLTETHDMQDNLLAVLPFTRTDPAGDSLLAGEMA